MMLLGTLSEGDAAMACLIGIERDRLVIVAQDDLTRFSWPVTNAHLDGHKTALVIQSEHRTLLFKPDMPDRFRWIMTAALQEATTRKSPWWRLRKGPATRGLAAKLVAQSEAEAA